MDEKENNVMMCNLLGWEYSVGGHAGWWMPKERRIHFYRRRRWRRTRVKVKDFKQKVNVCTIAVACHRNVACIHVRVTHMDVYTIDHNAVTKGCSPKVDMEAS